MPRALSKFYNWRTSFWYRWLHRPIRMHVAIDNKVKQPRLTVVFLHGISATSETWRTTIRQFSANSDFKGIRMVALDLLGFGKSLQSNWLDYDYLDYEKALECSLKKLKVTSPLVLVGHSMGSLIAADFTVNYQTTLDIVGLILVSPPVLMLEELAKLPDKVYTKSYGSLYKLAKDEPAIEVMANFIQRFSSFSSRYIKTPAFERSMDNIILNPHNYKTYTKIKTPALIIHGHFDPLVMRSNLKKVASANPNIRFVSVIGHHDVSAQKRTKILIELKRIMRENHV